jgi:hypothetical protein
MSWIVRIHIGVNNVQEFTSSDKPAIVDGLLTANWTSKVIPAFINYEKVYLITIEEKGQSDKNSLREIVSDAPGILKFGKTRQ